MEEDVKKKIESAVLQSGFPLEHYVGNILKKHGWNIISNRYYIDDLKNVEREIDILAYKTYIDEDELIQYYTTLIISCKKSEKNTWCFLTRKSDVKDCNIDWTPLHFCTSDERLKYMTEKHREILISRYKRHVGIKHLYDFPETVFAYQQMKIAENNKKGHNAGDYYIEGNDDIYNSIITSIKALETEKSSAIKRNIDKKDYTRYYMFHLVSVFDGIMVKDCFDEDGNQHIEKIDEIKYLNRHIVNKVDDFYIVNFVTKDNFEYRLNLWDYFHSYNSKLLKFVVSEYYKDIFSDKEKVDVEWGLFQDMNMWRIGWALQNLDKEIKRDSVNLSYSYENNILKLHLFSNKYIGDDVLDKLNQDTTLMRNLRMSLMDVYRYSGDFYFCEEDLPF